MKRLLLPTLFLLATITSVRAQIGVFAIDWTKFKGAKTITVSTPQTKYNATMTVFLDREGRIQQIQNFGAGILTMVSEYSYFADGKLKAIKRISELNMARTRSSSRVYIYTAGQMEEQNLAEDGSVQRRMVAKLDANGNHTEESLFDRNNNIPEERLSYTYDMAGNRTSVTVAERRPPSQWGDSLTVKSNRCRYDGHNNAIAWETYNMRDELLKTLLFQYEYDSRGNWTKRTESYQDKAGNVTPSGSMQLDISYY